MYIPNTRISKYMKQRLIVLKGELDISKIKVVDVNIPLRKNREDSYY